MSQSSPVPTTKSSSSRLDLALLRGAIEEMPFGIATTRDGTILHANVALEQLYGATRGALDGMPVDVLFADDALRAVRAEVERDRVFDGRVEGISVEGLPLDLEAHIERYVRTAD